MAEEEKQTNCDDKEIFHEQNNWNQSQTQSIQWTQYRDIAHPAIPEKSPQERVRIVEQVPKKSSKMIGDHREGLVHGISKIHLDGVELSSYANYVAAPAEEVNESANEISFVSTAGTSTMHKKRRAKWTEEEHRQFLIGLEKYGRGDWRGISRNCVKSKTPAQVASHAQKYFLRQSSANNERRRASIHDITTVDTKVVPPSIGQEEDFLKYMAKNENRQAIIRSITTVGTNLVPSAYGQNWAPPADAPMQQQWYPPYMQQQWIRPQMQQQWYPPLMQQQWNPPQMQQQWNPPQMQQEGNQQQTPWQWDPQHTQQQWGPQHTQQRDPQHMQDQLDPQKTQQQWNPPKRQ